MITFMSLIIYVIKLTIIIKISAYYLKYMYVFIYINNCSDMFHWAKTEKEAKEKNGQ